MGTWGVILLATAGTARYASMTLINCLRKTSGEEHVHLHCVCLHGLQTRHFCELGPTSLVQGEHLTKHIPDMLVSSHLLKCYCNNKKESHPKNKLVVFSQNTEKKATQVQFRVPGRSTPRPCLS